MPPASPRPLVQDELSERALVHVDFRPGCPGEHFDGPVIVDRMRSSSTMSYPSSLSMRTI